MKTNRFISMGDDFVVVQPARADASEFDDSKHPRDEKGRFGSSPAVGSAERPRLKDDPDLYFHAPPGSKLVPVASLTTTRARSKGIANAEKLMHAAAAGLGDKRKPITVAADGHGGYKVLDGNSTTAIARAHGFKYVRATEVD